MPKPRTITRKNWKGAACQLEEKKKKGMFMGHHGKRDTFRVNWWVWTEGESFKELRRRKERKKD